MSDWTSARRALALAAVALAVLAFPADANDAAHTMADKFAGEPDRSATANRDAARKADEEKKRGAERKAAESRDADEQRKREAERKADEARKQAAKRRAEELRKASEAKRREEADKAAQAKRTAEQSRAEEADMLARARREAEDLKAVDEARRLIREAEKERARAEELLAGQTPPEPDRTKPAASPGDDAAGPPPQTAQQKVEPAPAQTAADDDQARIRAAEARRLAEKLKRVRQIREARLAAQARREATERESKTAPVAPQTPEAEVAVAPIPAVPAPAASGEAVVSEAGRMLPSASAPAPDATAGLSPPAPLPEVERADVQPDHARETDDRSPPDVDVAVREPSPPLGESLGDSRVTVLLVMVPGNRGIRRHHKVADPVLCVAGGCYVSAGADEPAYFMPGRRALSLGNTWGVRAGACRESLGCVFRGVELDDRPSYVQPVDLRVIKHDRREVQAISRDSSCSAERGRISCSGGIHAESYSMWIVPESVAAAAGPEALERAVSEGLSGPRSADLGVRR